MAAVAVACFVAGTAVMILTEAAVPRAIGVALLVAFVVCGLLAIATPEYLDADEERRE
jgi:energy-converting hydrogenase Eha subunit C